jgi:hypothetical protein
MWSCVPKHRVNLSNFRHDHTGPILAFVEESAATMHSAAASMGYELSTQANP